MTSHDWLVLASLVFGALNSWQNLKINSAITELKLNLVERIAKTEQDVAVLKNDISNLLRRGQRVA